MPKQPEDVAKRLEDATEAALSLLRSIHESEKDMRALIREAHQAAEEVRSTITDSIEAELERQLEELSTQTKTAMSASTQKIFAEFDKLTKPLMSSFDDLAKARDELTRQVVVIGDGLHRALDETEERAARIAEERVEQMEARLRQILAEHGLA